MKDSQNSIIRKRKNSIKLSQRTDTPYRRYMEANHMKTYSVSQMQFITEMQLCWDIMTHLWECLKLKTLTISCDDKNVKQQETSCTAVGNIKQYKSFEQQFASFL